jgi:hypothetical protein
MKRNYKVWVKSEENEEIMSFTIVAKDTAEARIKVNGIIESLGFNDGTYLISKIFIVSHM